MAQSFRMIDMEIQTYKRLVRAIQNALGTEEFGEALVEVARNASEPPKPLFPLKHDFITSLNNYIDCAGALAEIMRTCLQHGLIDKKVVDIAQERLDKFDAARS